MRILIVENARQIGSIWQGCLVRQGHEVDLTDCADDAIRALVEHDYSVIILDLVLADQSGLSVADFARFRRPQAKVILVTSTTFFSDGSVFDLAPNARAFMPTDTSPDDLAAIVEHYGAAI